MRLVQVAKALGMTGQQLRHELQQVDFGVKPTDREIPDSLAQGIVRFVARKHGIEVDMNSLMGIEGEEGETAQDRSDAAPEEAPEEASAPSSLNVLRKLSLDDVSKEDIAKTAAQQPTTHVPRPLGVVSPLRRKPSKQEKEALTQEEKAMAGRRGLRPQSGGQLQQIKKKEGPVTLPAQVTVKEFAEKTGIQVPQVIQALMKNGVLATINQNIDYDTAAIVASELGVTVQKEQGIASAEHLLSRNLEELLKDEPENLTTRPPIVVVMGHVDHGKTAILDAIRKTNVVAGEAGGITQHIGAYQVMHTPSGTSEEHLITFLDTPGHEAFTAMRARGAQVTDIAIIVVSAEEGVRPTTIEAIHHAKDAGVPMIVAINKMDKERADPDRVKGELAAHELTPEEWGGQTPMILCSAVTKQGIPELLDSIVLASEMAELKANKNRRAVATIIESHLDSSHGPLGTVIVNTGTLKVGDVFVCGSAIGRVRSLINDSGDRLDHVLPSGPARVSGFDSVPQVGDILQVVSSEHEARTIVESVREQSKQATRSFADLVTRLSEGKLTQLKVVLKADTQGSLEALKDALSRQTGDGVAVKVIHAALGSISESDVMMAAASDGIVMGFHVLVSPAVQRTAEREGVEVRQYEVLYAMLEDVEGLLKGLVEPEEEEQILGHLEVLGIFLTKKSEQIIGGKVTDGVIKRLPFRLQRRGEEVGRGRITSLKHAEKDIKEAKEGAECGMRVESSIPVEQGDVIEVYTRELKRKDRA